MNSLPLVSVFAALAAVGAYYLGLYVGGRTAKPSSPPKKPNVWEFHTTTTMTLGTTSYCGSVRKEDVRVALYVNHRKEQAYALANGRKWPCDYHSLVKNGIYVEVP